MISDFNHLVKCFRSGITNDQSTEFMTPYGLVKLKHWKALLEIENYLQPNLKIAYKLTPAHLNPKGFQKMNVPLAYELFGHEVSVAMTHYQSMCDETDELADSTPTQKFIDLMYNLIQAMSSRTPRDALYVGEDCRQRQAILKFLQFLEDWEKLETIPVSQSTITGFKVTLRGTLEILDTLHNECNYNYLMTATLSQDPLERFFSIMRFSCGGNDHPDPKMFAQVYRLASCFSLIRPPKGCNVDGAELLKTLMDSKNIIKTSNESKKAWLESIDTMLDGTPTPGVNQNFAHEHDHNYNEAETSEAVQSYIAGYVGRKLKKIISCDDCLQTLQSSRKDGETLARNDVINKMDLYGGLFYASNALFTLTKQLEESVLRVVGKSKVNLDTINDISIEICKKKIQTVGCCARSRDLTKKIIDFYVIMRSHFLAKSENKRCETAKIKVKMHRKKAKLIT